MKKTMIILLVSAFITAGQLRAQTAYAWITDASGNTIRGDGLERGYERQFTVYNLTNAKQINPTLSFQTPVQPATGTFQNIQLNKQVLARVVITICKPRKESILRREYTITMENVSITECSNSSDNGVNLTRLGLQAQRVGFTYYTVDRITNQQSVSSKSGYDFTTNKAWTAF